MKWERNATITVYAATKTCGNKTGLHARGVGVFEGKENMGRWKRKRALQYDMACYEVTQHDLFPQP